MVNFDLVAVEEFTMKRQGISEKLSSKCETNISTHKAACHHRGIIWIAVGLNTLVIILVGILSFFCLQQIHNMETQQKHLTTALQV